MRADQRRRLAMAMVDAVGQDGYRATRVADVIARAGVSRKTFYELFGNKQDCLLATFGTIMSQAIRRL
ncbi:MAG TPA: helix-turn-helix domain-containing protein, partial [Solirubrobacteraceae bacterium]|nr:helix-turn-helix domain-containing protein [Solirubrobacteraceae bacterium]